MNIEIGLNRNSRTCYGLADKSARARQFWSEGMERARQSMISRTCSPSRSSRLELVPSRSRRVVYETPPNQESKKTKLTHYMREVLCGMGGKRGEIASYDVGTLHVLMALRESGKDELVRQVLTAADAGLEWKISIRNGDEEVIGG